MGGLTMENKTKTPFNKLFGIISSIFLLASIVIFISLNFLIQRQDLDETYTLAEKTASLLSISCQHYDEYMQGNSAKSMQELLDKATTFNEFILNGNDIDNDFLLRFIRAQHIGGIILLDENLNTIAQADIDERDSYALWNDVIHWDNTNNIIKYPKKTYVDHITLDGTPYDFAVIYRESYNGLILCYASTEKPNTDPYEVTINSFLANNSFYKNPMIVISDGDTILSSNIDNLVGTDTESCGITSVQNWSMSRLTQLEYDNQTWFGIRRIYNTYYIYIIYPQSEVFYNQTSFIAVGFMVYLVICIVILAVQRHFDKSNLKNMKKQLNIINATNTIYTSTILLHLDRMELEPIKMSERFSAAYNKHPNPQEFINYICEEYTDTRCKASLMEFLDISTVAERIRNNTYLENEFLNRDEKWYSILLIPQRYDSSNNVQAFLITTRDITDVKQAKELSFKDKLTGMYNRNYLELKAKDMLKSFTLPATLIMADCNYLKKINDTMGHEYGDLLITRVARCIRAVLPDNCTAIRVGGDEFLILCDGFSRADADKLIADIREQLSARTDDTLTLSVAFGVSTATDGEFSFAEAYKAADKDMYSDKQRLHAGR